jgi:hypothetical protein
MKSRRGLLAAVALALSWQRPGLGITTFRRTVGLVILVVAAGAGVVRAAPLEFSGGTPVGHGGRPIWRAADRCLRMPALPSQI